MCELGLMPLLTNIQVYHNFEFGFTPLLGTPQIGQCGLKSQSDTDYIYHFDATYEHRYGLDKPSIILSVNLGYNPRSVDPSIAKGRNSACKLWYL